MAAYLSYINTLCDQLDYICSPISEHEYICGVLNGLRKKYESICIVIENYIDSYPGICFKDVVFKLIGFDDKLQAYEGATEVSPHQPFYTYRGGYANRGRGHRGGYRGIRSYSTQGRGFHQQIEKAMVVVLSQIMALDPLANYVVSMGMQLLNATKGFIMLFKWTRFHRPWLQ